MLDTDKERIISSKEVLEKTGISRATLNNYIKMGIIPKPIVRKPIDGSTTIKTLGYFPVYVMESIKNVKELKKQGKSMDEIMKLLGNLNTETTSSGTVLTYEDQNSFEVKDEKKDEKVFSKKLQLTIEKISYPAYLLNYDFEIEWINSRAENRILNQSIWLLESFGKKNIFKLFFNWEFHSNVKNWKDLVAFHMSFAKLKFSKTWLSKLYKGITQNETRVLGYIYDEVIASPERTISDNQINLLKKGGSTERYRIYTIFFKEGILFIYAPSEHLR